MSTSAIAQNMAVKEVDEDDPYDSRSYFMAGLNCITNNVYLGRKDTVTIPYYAPYIGYHFKNGLYAKGLVSYTTAKGGVIDLTTIEAGYDHSFGKHFDGGMYVDKYFYNKNSLNVRANTKGSGGIYAQFSNSIIQPQATFDVNFNGKTRDYVVGFILDHRFAFLDKSLNITPAVGCSFGTQNYYDEYFINRINKKDKKGSVKSVVTSPNKFVPLVYEFSAKATYRVSKWLFTLTPVYAVPLSPATVTMNNATTNEKVSNTFYLELDICHR
jgi:outer membrane scaffolding protein for murein synthesis (MipA/OmpV family)